MSTVLNSSDSLFKDPSREEIEEAAQALAAAPGLAPSGLFGEEDQVKIVMWSPEEESLAKDHLAVYEAWASRAGSGDMTIDPSDFQKQMGQVLLLDAVDEGFDARYRVYGFKIAVKAGRDWTGTTVSEMNRTVQTNLSLFYRAGYRAVFLRKQPLFTLHRSPPWLSVESWSRLILPVCNDQGEVTKFIVSILSLGHIPMDSERLAELERRVQRRVHMDSFSSMIR